MSEHCSYCIKRLRYIYVTCLVCPRVSLCLDCVRHGAEAGKHKRWHKYTFKLSSSRGSGFIWTPQKESEFLEHIDSCGLGNWSEISTRMGVVSPIECRSHFLSRYASGILAKFYHNVPSIPEWDFNDCPEELCLSKTRIPQECFKRLGLKPKRDDFEHDYDNDAELPITRIRVDFLDDDLFCELALAQIDIYEEHLRRRRLRHVLLANLNLLTHLLPQLLPDYFYVSAMTKAASTGGGHHSNGQARAVLDQSRHTEGVFVCKRLLANQRRLRRRQFVGRGSLTITRMKSLPEHPQLENFKNQQQPPSSVESMQDSGMGYSESPLHFVPSDENAHGMGNSNPVGDITMGEGTSFKSESTPIPDTDALHPLTANISRNVNIACTTSVTAKEVGNQSIFDSSSTRSPDNCCIPPRVAEPLKPLLRFLSASEANTLLNQLHREHIVRQEIEQLQQLKRSRTVFLNETRLAGRMSLPSKVDYDEDDSSDDEQQQKKADLNFHFHGTSSVYHRRRRAHALFTRIKRGAKRRIATSDPSSSSTSANHRLGLRSGRITNLTSRPSRGRPRGTKRRGRPPLHHHGSRNHQRLLIRT